MGIFNCHFQCHYYLKNDNSFLTNFAKKEIQRNNILKQLNQNIAKNIKNSSDDFIISNYSNLISEKIISYIKDNKLYYKSKNFSFSNSSKPNTIEFPNENIFIGNMNKNNQIEGYGILIIKSKNIITEGIWQKGKIIFGRIFFPNDNIYEGELTHSKPNGKGKMLFSCGDIYKGDFIFGEITGKGTYIFNDKTYYCGDFIKGVFSGEGSMKWSNGVEYHGSFSDSSLNFKGKIFHDLLHEKYIGNFLDNEFNGKGIYKYKNGDIYEGNFEYGLRKGKGKYKNINGIEFLGYWDKDMPNGEGIIFCDKFKIKGIWKDGIKTDILDILEGDENIIDLDNIDLNIKTRTRKIIPSSLPHLYDNNSTQISQYQLESNRHSK